MLDAFSSQYLSRSFSPLLASAPGRLPAIENLIPAQSMPMAPSNIHLAHMAHCQQIAQQHEEMTRRIHEFHGSLMSKWPSRKYYRSLDVLYPFFLLSYGKSQDR